METINMKAIRIHSFGGPEVLTYEDVPRPQAGQGEVLVRVHAAGVNPADWKTRQRPFGRLELPVILGWDISGVIEEVGPDVQNFQPGDEVYGMIRFPLPGAAYAEFTAAPVAHIAPKPTSLDHAHAAALPLVALTAWQALFEKAGLAANQTVFINGAAGGVGHIAVQLAKNAGAQVIGTASGSKLEFLQTLGVDQPIDYKTTAFESVAHDVDIFFDTVGDALSRAVQTIKPGGIFVSVVPVGLALPEAEARNIKVLGHLVYPNSTQLVQIARLVDLGKLKPVVAATFPLSEAQQAHRMSESLHTSGKIVLQVVK